VAVSGTRQLVAPAPPPAESFTGVWAFSTSTTMADPGAGGIRINAATASAATQVAISRLTDGSVDMTRRLQALRSGDQVYVQDKDNSANFVRYQLSGAPTDNTTWFLLPVTFVSGAGAGIANNAKLLIEFNQSSGAGGGAGGPAPFACQGRLTTQSGVPVSMADRTAQATLYWTPYKGGWVSLYVGGTWTPQQFTEASIALPAVANSNYDVFIYPSGATVALELSAPWTNDTTRATALGSQNGVPVKAGDPTRLWVGIVRTLAAGQTEDSKVRRFVANYYQRVGRVLESVDSVARTSTSAAWSQVGAVQVEYLALGDEWLSLVGTSMIYQPTSVAGGVVGLKIGDSPTTVLATSTGSCLYHGASESTGHATLNESNPAGYYSRYLLFRASGGTGTAYADGSGAGYGGEAPSTILSGLWSG
jgi:hypothetical protein